MKVFGIGLPRTGTTSLTVALSQLGYDTWHFPPTLAAGVAADATCDGLIAANWRQLQQNYPDAKYILTLRALSPWLDSYRALYDLHYRNIEQQGLTTWLQHVNAVATQIYGQWQFDPTVWAAKYQTHVAEVQDAFAATPSQLLTLDIAAGAGWPQLCGFLGHPQPSLPFPRRNTRAVLGQDWVGFLPGQFDNGASQN